jgi:hypothetical protein
MCVCLSHRLSIAAQSQSDADSNYGSLSLASPNATQDTYQELSLTPQEMHDSEHPDSTSTPASAYATFLPTLK